MAENTQAPVNTVPAAQIVDEDGALIFSSGNGNSFSVHDPDVVSFFTVTLSVAHGALTLGSTAGLSFSLGDGTADATMTFSGSESSINAALEGLRYDPDPDYVGPDSLTISTSDNGNDGVSNALMDSDMVEISVNAVSAQPATAQDDAFVTSEIASLSGNLFADNGSGADSDPDGPALAIAAVNGSAAAVGTEIILPSGALLTVNADGTFLYDPNGAFELTPAEGSGASNTPSSDSFTYALAGGGTATVALTISGVDNDDMLEGGDGDDQLYGGGGVDTASYESASGGVDAYLYNGGFGEAFGAAGYDQLHDIENLVGSAHNDNLGGNGSANVLVGGDGDDGLRGNGGNNSLDGGSGDDFVNGGNGDDLIDGGAGLDRASYFQTNAALGGINVSLLLQGAAQSVGSQGWDTLVNIEHVSGTPFADTITGDAGDNWLWGSTSWMGAVQSTSNDDTIDGGDGNDLIQVGFGNHVLTGGSGNDTVQYGENGAAEVGLIISLALQGAAQATGAGNWTLSGFENLAGGSGSDQLTGDGNANVLAGGDGGDLLAGGDGNDSLYGDGAYGVTGSGSGRIILLTDADVAGGAVGGNDTLAGGLGDDLIDGGIGEDTASYADASGGVSAFLYRFGAGNGEASGADGNDTLVNIENLTGSAFNDGLAGNNLANVISGGDGHDGLRGNGGNDTLLGGNGDDFLNGGLGDDIIDGGAGNDRAAFFTDATTGITVDLNLQGVAQDTGQGLDTLIGIEGVSGTNFADTLTGDDGDNWLWGSGATMFDGTISAANNDTLVGNGGNDLLTVGIGNHNLSGGSGIDTVRFTENGSPEGGIIVSLALQGAAQFTGSGSWTLTGIENLSGGVNDDTLTGDGAANLLAGDLGNDTLSGGGGDDILYGDGRINVDTHDTGNSGPITTVADLAVLDPTLVHGNDLLEGGLGNDQLYGGGGIDTASYAHASGGMNVNLGAGFASGADGNDTLVGIENALGSQFADTLNGGGADNLLDGLGGNDVIQGQAGNDIIYGGDGDDTLRGDQGDNFIVYGGNDIIYGGNGNDGLRGGLGDDQMYGGANNDLLRGNGGVDYFDGGADDGLGFNGIGDRISFYEQRATQGAVADLRTGIISNDGFGNVETMVGIESLGSNTAFVDTFHGDDNRNYLAGDLGDLLYGHGGDDLFFSSSAAAMVDGGDGVDVFTVSSGGGWLMPDADGDGLAEAAGAASAGWTINLAAGTTLDGHGNAGLVNGIENVDGSELGDTLVGDGNANVLNGYDGNDLFEGRGGDDLIDGGNRIDTASYANASGSVNVNLGTGTASGADGNDTLISIENLTGSNFNDTLQGNLQNNVISGQGGNDIIQGSQGTDFVDGGAGGGDRLFMTTGNASLFAAATGARSYLIGASTISDSSGSLNTSFTSVERIAFSTVGNGDFDDIIDASGFVSAHNLALDIRLGNGDNQVTGSASNDRVFTGFGSNIVDGGAGHDYGYAAIDTSSAATVTITSAGGTLITTVGGVSSCFTNVEEMQVFGVGSAALTLDASGYSAITGTALYLVGHNGTDIMIGSAGSDYFGNITGQVLGSDVYTGNGGADIYDYTYAADSMNGDTITDFDIDDIIDLRFNNLEAGGSPLLANKFIGAAAFSGVAGEYRYQIDGTRTLVQVDSNGDQVADQTLTIGNGAFALAETAAGSNLLTLAAIIDPLAGVVADGYVEGATLFIDTNGNKKLDAGEAWTVTGLGGSFSLNVNQAGTLMAVGGVNADTGLANTMTLAAPSGSGVVNPLTTLIQAVVEQGNSLPAAEAKVLAALGLDPSLHLLDLDLLGQGTDPAALAAQRAAAMIANLVAAAEGAVGAGVATEGLLVDALAELVTGTGAGATIDLTDAATLMPLLTEALPGNGNVAAIAAEAAVEGDVISAATSLAEISAAQVAVDAIDYSIDNIFTGTSATNHLFGGGGNDTLNGLGGNDLLDGGVGNDTLDGGAGSDDMRGGAGNDLYFVDSASDVVTEYLGEGSDTVRSSINYTLGSDVEHLQLVGSAINGTGNILNNTLTGNELSNRLSGGGGRDTLVGGDGVDYLTGGAGNDFFMGEINAHKNASKNGLISLDVILDFTAGDVIDLRAIDANTSVAGDQAFAFKGVDANKLAGGLSFKVYDSVAGAESALGMEIDGVVGKSPYSGPVTMVFGNVDGGAHDFAIALIGTSSVNAGDFLL